LNALRGLFCGTHLDETKATGTIRSLVVDNGHLFNATKAAELIFKVTFLSPDAQPKYTKDVGRIRQTVRSPTRRRPP
jgi:hypothetical protein